MKPIDLKLLGKSYGGNNVYRNVCTFGKCLQLGLKRDKLTDDFVKNYISEVNKSYSYNHYLTGTNTNFIINDLEYILDDIFQRILNKLKNNLYGERFEEYVENLTKTFPFVKENILGIYRQTIHLKPYWSYYTPNDLDGRKNNPEMVKVVGKSFGKMIDRISVENQENIIFQNNGIPYKDELAPIFPGETYSNEKKSSKVPVKYIDDGKDTIMNEIVDTIYDNFMDSNMQAIVDSCNELYREKKNKTVNMFRELEEKDFFIKFFLQYQAKLIDFVYDRFYKKSYIYGLDYYLYENQYFLDLIDVVFVGEYKQKTQDVTALNNKINLDVIKELLIDGLKEEYYDHFVMKLFYKFEDENGELYEMEHMGENLYKVIDGRHITYVDLDKEEQELLKKLGDDGKRKIRWGLTLGLYSNKQDKLRSFKSLFLDKLNNSGYSVYLKQGGGNNVFNENNYLFQTNSLSRSTNMTLSSNIKRFFEFMPAITQNDEDGLYLGLDYYSKQPIIKEPFKQTDGKNMIIVGATGSGKTFFTEQMVSTNLKDKFFILDPTGSFAQLGNIGKGMPEGKRWEDKGFYIKSVFELDYNPIALDKKFYQKFNIDYRIPKKEKVKLVSMLLGVSRLGLSEDAATYINLLVSGIYDEYDDITIDLIKKVIKSILDSRGKNGNKYPQNPEFLWDTLEKDLKSADIYTALDQLLRQIYKLEADGQIYELLNKKDDLTRLFAEKTKIVINLVELGITDNNKMNDTSAYIFMYILQNILAYLSFQAKLVKMNKDKIRMFPRTYIVIDEIHILFKDKGLRSLYNLILRTVRNRGAQITGMSQATSDFAFSMDDDGSGSDLDVLNQNYVKYFFTSDDILAYMGILNKALGAKKKKKDEDDDDKEDIEKLRKLMFYYTEFDKVKKKNPKQRLMLVEYFGDFYLTEPQVSEIFLENMKNLSSG